MNNAIQGIRDWQANRKEAISKLEMEHAQMLEQYARKSAASSPAAGVGTSSRRQDDDDDALVQINLLEAELAQMERTSCSIDPVWWPMNDDSLPQWMKETWASDI